MPNLPGVSAFLSSMGLTGLDEHPPVSPVVVRRASWDGLLVVALASLAGGLSLARPLVTGFGALMVVGLGWRHLRPLVLCLALLVLGASTLRSRLFLDEFQQQWSDVRAALGAPARCVVRGTVARSPVLRGDALGWTMRIDEAECEGRSLPTPLRARVYGGPRDLARGDRVSAIAQLGIVRIFRNHELLDPTLGMSRSGVVLSGSVLAVSTERRATGWSAAVDRFREHVRSRIERTFSAPAIGMAKALVLGENDLTEEEDLAFRQSGLSHLLAVSGTHLVFAVVSVVNALAFLLVRIPSIAERTCVERWASALGAALAIAYADFAGGSGSAWRAAWMLAAAFSMRALDRRPDIARSIAISILVGVAFDPLAVYDLSFLLSLAATTGLITLGQRWARAFSGCPNRPVRLFFQGMAATVSSLLPCSVLLAFLSPELSLPGMVINVLAAPFGEVVALPLCLGHTVLSWFPTLEQGVAHVASGALLVVKQAAFLSTSLVDRFGWLALPLPMPNGAHVLVLVVGATLVLRVTAGSSTARAVIALRCVAIATTAAAFGLVEWRAIEEGAPRGVLRVSVLDVGQGDSTMVDLPDGRLMLIDAGGFVGSPVDPGERVIVPLLRARRRNRLDVVVLSHPHPDHFGGLLSVVRVAEVGEFWDTGQGQREGAGPQYAELMRELARRGIPVLGPEQLCTRREFGGATLDVVGPCPRVIPGRNANDNSWVFRLSFGKHAVLFTGDAEVEQEHEILAASRERIRADLLKVGHHGSRTSTSPEFLAAVKPQLATISCGVRNRYGHPHAQTLATLQQGRVVAYRLDDRGGLTWSTDGTELSVVTYRPP